MAFCMTASEMTEMGPEDPAETESLAVGCKRMSKSVAADDDPEVCTIYI